MKTVSLAEAKNQLTALVREAERGTPVQLSRRGAVVAVLLSSAEFERLRSAAAHARDFSSWASNWRAKLPPDFEGITPAEIARWFED